VRPVYPRWRGEHRITVNDIQHYDGLSPLARGTPATRGGGRQFSRFIPAGAGNTGPVRLVHFVAPVYPRWRGEHQAAEDGWERPDGLSPLARGTPITEVRMTYNGRFIPAGAGNTLL